MTLKRYCVSFFFCLFVFIDFRKKNVGGFLLITIIRVNTIWFGINLHVETEKNSTPSASRQKYKLNRFENINGNPFVSRFDGTRFSVFTRAQQRRGKKVRVKITLKKKEKKRKRETALRRLCIIRDRDYVCYLLLLIAKHITIIDDLT